MKKIIKVFIFLIILIIIINHLGSVFTPEWNDEWINTPIVRDFYDLPQNSLDVLSVGSSQVIKGFSSLELYKNYGISAYGIGISQQSIPNAYAWIRESLKTQSPKVICLEVKMSFEDTPEAQNRKGVDSMKFGIPKLGCMINDAIEGKSYESFISYLFPITRFHSRWKEYGKENFIEKCETVNYRGYSFSNEMCGNLTYKYLDETVFTNREMNKNRLKYLNKIVKLCEENEIKLILYKMPDMDWDIERYNTIAKFAKEKNIPYIDFNVKKIGDQIEFDYAKDCENENHLNIYGAEKITNYLGEYIKTNYNIEDKRENKEYSYLQEQLKIYNNIVDNGKLVNIFDPKEYIKALKNENFTVVLVKNDLINDGSESYIKLISDLGLNIEKINNTNYYAIFENGKIKSEEGSDKNIHLEMMIDIDKKIIINTENSSIIFEEFERSNFHPGIDICIYNNITNTFIESSFINLENGIVRIGR